mmetsp:Transcript_12166/g.35627  ORF Transcript_12166/g.35627 Transcript_12166/m.35627 type:complete len:431 (+) Transcript_12166:599-1891(+)
MRTFVTVPLLLGVWTAGLLIFTGIYMAVDSSDPNMECSLHPYPESGESIPFGTAFAFSLETATTVGYGLPVSSSAFFEPACDGIRAVIYFQMVLSMMFQAFLFSFFYGRLGRCESRGVQVLFSNKATLRRRKGDGRWVFEFRVYDSDPRHPLVEAHVRLYAIRQPRKVDKVYNVRPVTVEPLRLWKPNDDLGGVLLASVPTVVSHHVDIHSALNPRRRGIYYEDLGRSSVRHGDQVQTDLNLDEHVDGVSPDFSLSSCGMNLRELDSATGSRDGLRCDVCGETYNTRDNLAKHITFQKLLEKHDGVPVIGSHQELDVDTVLQNCSKGRDKELSSKELSGFIAGETEPYNAIEILVVLEAIEPLMSGTFQSMQSYTIEDIEFGAEFVHCFVANDDRSQCAAKMDFDLFHKTKRVSPESKLSAVPENDESHD